MTEITLTNVEATVLKLEDGDALLIRVDPEEFTDELREPFMEALEEVMTAAGHDTARCILIAANTFELSIVRA